jgi:hypothetical protein
MAYKSVLCFIAVLSMGLISVSQAAANNIPTWEANYKKLVKILKETNEVGQCTTTVSSSGDPDSPESFAFNILNSNGMRAFGLDSPRVTQGRSRVVFNSRKTKVTYSVSDMVGWSNLVVYIDAKRKVLGFEMNKTLPSGEIYDVGISCGTLDVPNPAILFL